MAAALSSTKTNNHTSLQYTALSFQQFIRKRITFLLWETNGVKRVDYVACFAQYLDAIAYTIKYLKSDRIRDSQAINQFLQQLSIGQTTDVVEVAWHFKTGWVSQPKTNLVVNAAQCIETCWVKHDFRFFKTVAQVAHTASIARLSSKRSQNQHVGEWQYWQLQRSERVFLFHQQYHQESDFRSYLQYGNAQYLNISR